MAIWNNATVTNDGHALQAKLLSTDKLQITRAVIGKNRVSADQIINQTAISNIAQELTVESLKYDTLGNAIIKVSINNLNLATGFTAHQIGIYATDPDKGEILYAIAQEENNGDDIPSISEQPNGYYCTWNFSLTFGAASAVNVTIDLQHAITREEADDLYADREEVEEAIREMDNVYIVPYDFEFDPIGDLWQLPDGLYDGIRQAYNEGKLLYVKTVITEPFLGEEYAVRMPLTRVENFDSESPYFSFTTSINNLVDYSITIYEDYADMSKGTEVLVKLSRITSLSKAYRNYEKGSEGTFGQDVPSCNMFIEGLNTKQNTLTLDEVPTAGSKNFVNSGAIAAALEGKVSKEEGMGLSKNNYSDEAKTKLEGIEKGANKTTVDSTLNETSTNPVQNKAVYAALENKVSKVTGKGLSTEDFTTALKEKLVNLDANSDVFIVNVSYKVTSAPKITVSSVDKTYAEVLAAVNAGKHVVLAASKSTSSVQYVPMVLCYPNYYIIFENADLYFKFAKDGTMTGKQYVTLPVYSNLNTYESGVGSGVLINSTDNKATGGYSTAGGSSTSALGNYSRTGGYKTTAACDGASAEGYSSYHSSDELPNLTNTTDPVEVIEAYDYSFMLAFGKGAHAEGIDTLACGEGAHAEGDSTMAVADGTHTEGYKTEARGVNSHAEGEFTEALGEDSHVEGYFSKANGDYSHAANYYNIANQYQTVVGRLSKDTTAPTGETDTTGSLFIVGNGTNQGDRANAFRVAADGKVYGTGSYNSSGADVAEMWEWEDGNPNGEDRRGLLVTLNGDKIRPANADDDFILGFVSAVPCLVGNAADDWHGKYLKDVFGQPLTEKVEVPEQTIEREKKYIDEETGEEKTEIVKKVIPAHTETRFILNPEYDPEREYIPREERKEWNYVGFHGQIVAVDDGTCQVNGYCAPSKDGIVTASATATDIRVMQRIDDTHIKVYVR